MIGRGTEVLGENLPQCRFVHHKPYMMPRRELGPPRLEAGVVSNVTGSTVSRPTRLSIKFVKIYSL
jgi:hypothetical protein